MAKFVAGSLNLISVFSFSSFERGLLLMYPLAVGSTVSHLRPRLAYILGNFGHARSQDGRQSAAVKPPLYFVCFLPSRRFL